MTNSKLNIIANYSILSLKYPFLGFKLYTLISEKFVLWFWQSHVLCII